MFSFLYILIWLEPNYVAMCLCKDPNVISQSNWLVVYLLPTAISSVIGNNRVVNRLVLPVEKDL